MSETSFIGSKEVRGGCPLLNIRNSSGEIHSYSNSANLKLQIPHPPYIGEKKGANSPPTVFLLVFPYLERGPFLLILFTSPQFSTTKVHGQSFLEGFFPDAGKGFDFEALRGSDFCLLLGIRTVHETWPVLHLCLCLSLCPC